MLPHQWIEILGKVDDEYMNEKAILLNSGGLDSLASAGLLLTAGVDLMGLNVNYGQAIWSKEIAAAEQWTNVLKKRFGEERISLKSIELRDYHNFVSDNPVVRGVALGQEIDPIVNFVPGRNIVFLLFAAIYGYDQGIRNMVLSGQESDHISGDLSTEFQDSMAKMLSIGMGTYGRKEPYQIWSPLLRLGYTKGDAVKWLIKNNMPVEMSWSCYSVQKNQCGKCHNCVSRREAFTEAALPDPTEYAD